FSLLRIHIANRILPISKRERKVVWRLNKYDQRERETQEKMTIIAWLFFVTLFTSVSLSYTRRSSCWQVLYGKRRIVLLLSLTFFLSEMKKEKEMRMRMYVSCLKAAFSILSTNCGRAPIHLRPEMRVYVCVREMERNVERGGG